MALSSADLDRDAVVRGAANALFFAVPFAAVNAWAAGDSSRQGWRVLSYLLVLVAFMFAGYVAARIPLARPLTNGAAAGLATFVVVEVVVVAGRALRGASPGVGGVVFTILLTGLFAASLGVLGAMVAVRYLNVKGPPN